MKFPLHTQDSAPEASKPLLAQVESTFGFVSNLTATLAESPAALAGYLQLSATIQEHSALSPQEQQIVMLAVSEANGCDYCMAAHSLIAGMAKVPEATVVALVCAGCSAVCSPVYDEIGNRPPGTAALQTNQVLTTQSLPNFQRRTATNVVFLHICIEAQLPTG
jgi:AhpD family alkylhydroperoxidase